MNVPSRVGEQLVLELDDVRLNVPWAGVSPRVLTAAYRNVIFQAQAAKARAIFGNPDQCDLFEIVKKAPPVRYGGAPSLLPFPRGGG